MIRNQDDLTEILSIEEIEQRKDTAYEELQLAIAVNENAEKEYLAGKDVIIQTIDSLCQESIVVDKELREFRKLASEKILFDFVTVYKSVLRNRVYKPNNAVLVEHFSSETEKMGRIDELRAQEEQQLRELKDLEVAKSVAAKSLAKATRRYQNICTDLEYARSFKINLVIEEFADYTPTIVPAALNNHLEECDSDGDCKSVDSKSVWERFVGLFKKLLSNFSR